MSPTSRGRRAAADAAPVRCSIVLPAHDEEPNIEAAVRDATRVGERLFTEFEIIVVDDGSRDRTAELVGSLAAVDPRIRLLTHRVNLGYGEALRTGFRAAGMDLVFFTDADNQFDLDELEAFVPLVEHVDVVAGYRIRRCDPLHRRLIARAWNLTVRVLFHVSVRDIDCAFKLFRREVFDRLDLEAVGAMVNTELMVKLSRSGASVVEIGVTHHPRRAGRPTGASPRVIFVAGRELIGMYRRLRRSGYRTASELIAADRDGTSP